MSCGCVDPLYCPTPSGNTHRRTLRSCFYDYVQRHLMVCSIAHDDIALDHLEVRSVQRLTAVHSIAHRLNADDVAIDVPSNASVRAFRRTSPRERGKGRLHSLSNAFRP